VGHLPSFKQYREADGRFYFKLVDAKGQVLLQSLGFESPREAGLCVTRLKAEGPDALPLLQGKLDASAVAPDAPALLEALRALRAAQESD